MATVEIETTVKVEVEVESATPADLFKEDVMSPMDVDLPDSKDPENDDDSVKDESDLEEEERTSSSSSEPPKSRSETPAPAPKKEKKGPQLIGDLPRAEPDAMKTFEVLESNFYQYQSLGKSREALESMTCDCSYKPGDPDPDMACGYYADCINRLTQVECMDGDCRCKSHCRNQRMQRKDYASIEIVKTEMKGFGLRAGSNIRKDDFIYEYIGDVVSQPTFAKRMREYADEGIKHFYFMMLQKDEFLDATKRGGIGRFANHSCNPNCYVAKWTVGQRVRMGIYAKRNIVTDEELTFNYNVDRYGHEAQQCYCGEPNCVGVLGGKTQTDVATMDDLFLDALGISDEVAMLGLKGNKKKKSKKLDGDYCPELTSLTLNEVPKVVQALQTVRTRVILVRLLGRLRLTSEGAVLRQLMRLRGCTLIRHILEENTSESEICILLLESLRLWPFTTRKKIEDSQIEESVKKLEGSENEHIRSLTKEILDLWAGLTMGYRIPKQKRTAPEPEVKAKVIEVTPVASFDELWTPPSTGTKDLRSPKRFRAWESIGDEDTALQNWSKPRPPSPEANHKLEETRKPKAKSREWVEDIAVSRPKPPTAPRPKSILKRERTPEHIVVVPPQPNFLYPKPASIFNTDTIIEEALAKAQAEKERTEALRKAKKAEEERKAKERAEKEAARKRRQERKEKKEKYKNMSREEKEAMKTKRLQKLIGEVCVKQMNQQCRQKLDRETFKKRAKEMTDILVEKEKKSSWYAEGKLDALPEHKAGKMKQFAHDFIKKVLHRIKKEDREKYKERHASTSEATPLLAPHLSSAPSRSDMASPTTPSDAPFADPDNPNSVDGPGISIEEALGLDANDISDDGEDDGEMDMDEDDDDDEEEKSGDPSPASEAQRPSVEPAVKVVGDDVEVEPGSTPFRHSQDPKVDIARSPEIRAVSVDKGKAPEHWNDIPEVPTTVNDDEADAEVLW